MVKFQRIKSMSSIHLERWGAIYLACIFYTTYHYIVEPSPHEDTYEPFHEWVNLNSFTSRLYGANLIKWYYFGIWAMRDSLESPQNLPDDILDNRILVAAQWIYHSKSRLFTLVRSLNLSIDQAYALRSPTFPRGDISMSRWLFWKERFERESRLAPSEMIRIEATRAYEAMNEEDGGRTRRIRRR